MNKLYQKNLFTRKNAAKRRIGGFTLIELLVVVLIIGILSAVALPQYQKAVLKSRQAQATVILKSVEQNLTEFILANGGGPDWRQFSDTVDFSNKSCDSFRCRIGDYIVFYSGGPSRAYFDLLVLYAPLSRNSALATNSDNDDLLGSGIWHIGGRSRRGCIAGNQSTLAQQICKSESKDYGTMSGQGFNIKFYYTD